MIEYARIKHLNDEAAGEHGDYVLYRMQQSQRAHFNPTLELAARAATAHDLSLVVVFGLMENYPDANERHLAFMLAGLAETEHALKRRNIKMVTRRCAPDQAALALAPKASVLICDRGYLRHQRQWRKNVASQAGRQVTQVEGDVVVPVETACSKPEFAARTLRPELNKVRNDFLEGLTETRLKRSSLRLDLKSDLELFDPGKLLGVLDLDRSVKRVDWLRGGTGEARARLHRFLSGALDGYHDARNDPVSPRCSMLSPYLHFGQISPVEVARKVIAAKAPSMSDKEAFPEELIVRRELAVNFVHYRKDYDRYAALPDWAKKTLAAHQKRRARMSLFEKIPGDVQNSRRLLECRHDRNAAGLERKFDVAAYVKAVSELGPRDAR